MLFRSVMIKTREWLVIAAGATMPSTCVLWSRRVGLRHRYVEHAHDPSVTRGARATSPTVSGVYTHLGKHCSEQILLPYQNPKKILFAIIIIALWVQMQGAASSAPTSKTGFCRDAACCILLHESRCVINVCIQKPTV